MTKPTTYLGQRFAEYQDSWPTGGPSANAIPCGELEERLAFALQLYQLVQEQYEAICARLLASGQAYDLPAAKYVEQLLSQWITPAAAALKHLDAAEAQGCKVERATPFRDAVLDVRISLGIPVDRAAAQAERFAREGFTSTTTTEDLRRELRSRVGSKSQADHVAAP